MIWPFVMVSVQPTVAAARAVVSKLTLSPCDPGNPDPVMEIDNAFVLATTPTLGLTAIAAIVVVRLAVAVLNAASVAEMAYVPAGNTGTLNVAITHPFVNVAVGVTGRPLIEKAENESPTAFAKPEPTTVTVVPTAAGDGTTILMVGAPVVVYVADAPEIPVAVIV